MLHIKLKGMERRAPFKHIFCPQTHPRPLGSGKNLSECGHVAYQIIGKKSIDQYRNNIFDLTHALDLWVGLRGVIF